MKLRNSTFVKTIYSIYLCRFNENVLLLFSMTLELSLKSKSGPLVYKVCSPLAYKYEHLEKELKLKKNVCSVQLN